MKYYFTYLKSLEIPTNVPSKARGGTVPPRPPHQIRLCLTEADSSPEIKKKKISGQAAAAVTSRLSG